MIYERSDSVKLFILVTIYSLINSYLLAKIILWLSKFNNIIGSMPVKIIVGIIYFLCFLSVLTGYFLKKSKWQKRIQKFANVFTGMMFYMIILAIGSDLVRIITTKLFDVSESVYYSNRYVIFIGSLSVFVVTIVSLYGYFHAKKIKVKKYSVNISNKKTKLNSLRIAFVADFHLGYSIGYEMMEKMRDVINQNDVDLVLIGGDIFDNSAFLVDDMKKCENALRGIKSKYGSFAVYGNHDVDQKLLAGFQTNNKAGFRNVEMDKILKRSNITVLNDEVLNIDDFYLIGRKDYENTGDNSKNRLMMDKLMNLTKKNKVIIVLEHEPKNLKHLSQFPIDLHLAGHTHAGQYFPINLGTKLIWQNHYGIKKFNNMTSIVTSGIGVYGPNMRVATSSEVVIVDVKVDKK